MASLAEILSTRGDADYAEGGLGGTTPVFNSAVTVGYLQHAADMQAQANKYVLQQHDENLKNALSNYQGIDTTGVFGPDKQALMGQYASVGKDIAQNFGVLRNPLSNPAQAIKLEQSEGNFRQTLAQSKMDGVYATKQQQFLDQHPEFNTPENRSKIDSYIKTPVGQRAPFQLAPPLVYNPDSFYKTMQELSKQKYSTAKTNGKYISKEDGEKFDLDRFTKLATNPAGVDQYGQSLESARRKAYNDLPQQLKQLHNNSYDQYVKDEIALHLPINQVSKTDLDADPFAKQKQSSDLELGRQIQKQGFDAGQNALDRANQLLIANLRKEAKDPNAVPTVRQDLIERARTGVKNDVGIGAGEELKAVLAANPLYKGPLKINIDPKDKNIQTFIVPTKEVNGVPTEPYAVRLDASNPETYQAGLNQLLNDITGEKVTLSKAVSQGGKGKVVGGVQNPTIKPGQSYNIGGKDYHYEQIQKAANASGMTVEEYLKEVNK